MLSSKMRFELNNYLYVLNVRRKQLDIITNQLKKGVSIDEFLALNQLLQRLDEMLLKQIRVVKGQL